MRRWYVTLNVPSVASTWSECRGDQSRGGQVEAECDEGSRRRRPEGRRPPRRRGVDDGAAGGSESVIDERIKVERPRDLDAGAEIEGEVEPAVHIGEEARLDELGRVSEEERLRTVDVERYEVALAAEESDRDVDTGELVERGLDRGRVGRRRRRVVRDRVGGDWRPTIRRERQPEGAGDRVDDDEDLLGRAAGAGLVLGDGDARRRHPERVRKDVVELLDRVARARDRRLDFSATSRRCRAAATGSVDQRQVRVQHVGDRVRRGRVRELLTKLTISWSACAIDAESRSRSAGGSSRSPAPPSGRRASGSSRTSRSR